MILFYFFKTLETILMLLPHKIRKAFFLFLAKVAYLIDKKHRRIVDINLDIAFKKSLTREQKDEIALSCYQNLMMNFLYLIEVKRYTNEQILDKVTFENKEIFNKYSNDAYIICMAHYGNWEIEGVAIALLSKVKTNAVYKGFNNNYFTEYVKSSRTKFHVNMIEKRGALKFLTRAIRNKEGIALLVDQNVHQKDGIEIEMFGRRAYQSSATSSLARKYGIPIIPVSIQSEDHEKFVVKFEEPIFVEKSDDEASDIKKATQAQVDILEKIITKNPKGWFWCHKRWKTGNPGLYD